MAARVALLLALLASLSGCVRLAEDQIERARGSESAATPPQESVATTPASPSPTVSAPLPSPSPTPPAAPLPWPREGSHVAYAVQAGTFGMDGSDQRLVFANATWRYHDGDWRGSCDGTARVRTDSGWATTSLHADYAPSHPPHWPLFDARPPPPLGGNVTVWYLQGCSIATLEGWAVYAGEDNETLPVDGHPQRVATFVAENPPDANPVRTEWRQDTGLVVSWEWARSTTHSRGEIVDVG